MFNINISNIINNSVKKDQIDNLIKEVDKYKLQYLLLNNDESKYICDFLLENLHIEKYKLFFNKFFKKEEINGKASSIRENVKAEKEDVIFYNIDTKNELKFSDFSKFEAVRYSDQNKKDSIRIFIGEKFHKLNISRPIELKLFNLINKNVSKEKKIIKDVLIKVKRHDKFDDKSVIDEIIDFIDVTKKTNNQKFEAYILRNDPLVSKWNNFDKLSKDEKECEFGTITEIILNKYIDESWHYNKNNDGSFKDKNRYFDYSKNNITIDIKSTLNSYGLYIDDDKKLADYIMLFDGEITNDKFIIKFVGWISREDFKNKKENRKNNKQSVKRNLLNVNYLDFPEDFFS